MPDEDRGRRAGNATHPVMFGHPVAVIAKGLGQLREIDGVSQRLPGRGPIHDRRRVQHRKTHVSLPASAHAHPFRSRSSSTVTRTSHGATLTMHTNGTPANREAPCRHEQATLAAL